MRRSCLALVVAMTAATLVPAQQKTARTQITKASFQQRIEHDQQRQQLLARRQAVQLKRKEARARRLAQQKEHNARRAAQRALRRAEQQRRRAAQMEIREARSFRRTKTPGDQVRPRVEKLTRELTWHDSLDTAQKVSQQSGKPIVWIHALGEVSGVL